MRDVVERLDPKRLAGTAGEAIGKMKAGLRAGGCEPATAASRLRHIKALLRWAHKRGTAAKVPPIDMPRVEAPAKGRPLTGEEFARVPAAVPGVVGDDRAESGRHLLRGLWLSGLRTDEATAMTGDDRDGAYVRLDGKFPALVIPGRLRKSGRNTTTPDFAALPRETHEGERAGFVFDPAPVRGGARLRAGPVSRTVAAIGNAGGVGVKAGPPPRAHDLRRSFRFRWGQTVLPQQLGVPARHSTVVTTLTDYAEAGTGMTAEAVWAAVAGVANESANGGSGG